MRGLGILVLIIVFFWLVWPSIARWLKRKAMERAEDYMRASMGMPPRNKKRTKSDDSYSGTRNSYGWHQEKNPFGHDRYSKEPLIPKEYAEYVEFVETKDFSERETKIESNNTEIYHESQISDAEYIEIKKTRTK